MVRELLAAIDKYGVMRNVSWDGVRVLLLLIPLTEGWYGICRHEPLC